MKKVLSVVLALVMVFSVVSISAMAKVIGVDYTMSIGETRTVSLPGVSFDNDRDNNTYVIVKFVPAGSGKVAISSATESSANNNPVLEVFKGEISTANSLGEFEDNASSKRNFYYELNCEAGQVYYLVMHNSFDAKKWDVSITCLHETYKDGYCLTCLKECEHIKADNIVGCCPCGEAYDGMDISADSSIIVDSNDAYYWFRFEPEESGAYIMSSDNTDDESTILKKSADPKCIVVDETGEIVLANDYDISSENKNFAIPFLFEKGERYFIGVSDKKDDSDKWTFTLNKAASHTIEIPTEVEVEKETIIENEDGTTTTVVEKVIETVMVPVEHDLEYIPEKGATCQNVGHTSAVYCEACDKYFAGNTEIPKVAACKDDDNNNHCDWCDRVMVEPEDPTKDCSCNCHKDGISKFFFDFILFFQKIFRLNSVCSCGVRHY